MLTSRYYTVMMCVGIMTTLRSVQTLRQSRLTPPPHARGNLSESEMKHMIEVWQKLCPGSYICPADGHPEDTNQSCCASCACAESCGIHTRCCFKEDEELHTQGDVCMKLQSSAVENEELPYFYVVTEGSTSRDDGDIDVKDEDKGMTACRDQNVAQWGNIFPVFSPTSGKIYINKLCAIANNVFDFIFSQPYISCNGSTSYDVLSDILGTSTQLPDDCVTQFYFESVPFVSISRQQCFRHNTNRCDLGTNFDIPTGLVNMSAQGITKEQIIRYCESSLHVRTFRGSTHANPFCFMCNKYMFAVVEFDLGKCQLMKNSYHHIQHKLEGSFTRMLVSVKVNVDTRKEEKATMPTACAQMTTGNQVKPDCRPAYCPTGQIRNQTDQRCTIVVKPWFQEVRLILKLTPLAEVGASEFLTLLYKYNDNLQFDIKSLIGPWFSHWDVGMVAMTIVEACQSQSQCTNSSLQNIIIVFKLRNPENSEFAIPYAKPLLTGAWHLNIANSSTELRPDLLEYDIKIADIGQPLITKSLTHNATIGITDKTDPAPAVVIFARQFMLNTDGFVLKKTMFCQQIELMAHEFELFAGNNVLMYTAPAENVTLLTNEFDLLRDRRHGGHIARVCLENVGYHIVATVNACSITTQHVLSHLLTIMLLLIEGTRSYL